MSGKGRDRLRAWLLFLAGVAFIALTLDVAYEVSLFLRSRGYLWQTIQVLFAASSVVLLYLLVFGAGLRSPWVYARTAPFLVLFVLAMLRTRSSPSERFHFLEYGILFLLALRAAAIDLRGAWSYPVALVATGLAGWFDEWQQGLSPVRYYDVEDIEMNVLAAALAGLVCLALFGLRPDRARFDGLASRPDDAAARDASTSPR